MSNQRIRIGVIGAGDVTRLYLPDLGGHEDLEVVAVGDRNPDRAEECADRYGILRHGDVASVLEARDVDLVLNLTSPASHLAITRAALEHGKHVFSEKPLGTDLDEARAVLAVAERAGLVIGCAPDAHLWNGFQDALRLLRDGAVGEAVFARCQAVLAGPESWHPRPQFLYAHGGGPLLDIGPYYLTAMIVALGPVSRVRAVGTAKSPTRTIGSGPLAGTEFPVEVPSLTTAILEFASGIAGTVLLTFDSASHRGGGLEILGTRGTLRTPDPNLHEGPSAVMAAGSTEWRDVPLGSSGAGRPGGLVNLARHLRGLEPLRVGSDLAFHVLETMLAIDQAASRGRSVEVHSRCHSPEPLPAGWDAGLLATAVPSER
ncbi:Gfo/Idh/MocA family protein [Agromyces albus]|uniref:Gfo/Idh/MocA family oxidoreductase n=1 Tax=Agromyces albus TaxID=205332 RepID=A0A4Q2L6H1_9MICO|nr:Gfo/Idh/MocA family oxidoreductase [Agromyces albus]RXZ71821.1 Gfo/Idh/MocA family oxidoreductase [Agromyces albus]